METAALVKDTDREIKGGSTRHKERRLPLLRPPPSHLPASFLHIMQCEMENRATDTVVHSVVNNHPVRNSEGDLTLRLSMQGSTLQLVI